MRTALTFAATLFLALEAVGLTLLGQGFLGAMLPTGMALGAIGYALLHVV